MDEVTLPISSPKLYACSRMTSAPQVLRVARTDAATEIDRG
jgi:hypothetical protein